MSLATLGEAGHFLAWLNTPGPKVLSSFSGVDVFAIVALATLARKPAPAMELRLAADPVSMFATAVGLHAVVEGRAEAAPAAEPNRTVRMARFGWFEAHDMDPLARDIARLVARAVNTPTFHAIKYVVIELLRNVAQHSEDELGGVVAAQVIDRPEHPRSVQVAVADAGVGILEGLTRRKMHPGLTDIQVALHKALQPHFSGTFPEGQTGTAENAGLGLYVLSELSKETGGSFLLASRGEGLLLRGAAPDPRDRATFIDSGGYPGTLVVFECVLDKLRDFDSIFKCIRDRADAQKLARSTSGVVRFVDSPPEGVPRRLLSIASEDTAQAAKFATEVLLPDVAAGRPVVLDFINWQVFSQSYLHALLYLVIRMAWATKTMVYVVNAGAAVRSGIEWVEGYALAG
jgi:hypothetical protein